MDVNFDVFNMEEGVAFKQVLKEHILHSYKHSIYKELQPLMGGFIDENSIGLSVLNSQKKGDSLLLKCSVFYEEKIGGCNCNDAPHSENGYCEIQIELSQEGLLIL